MIDFKDKIAEEISKVLELTKEDLKDCIEIPKDTKMGDYALPCFKLAKRNEEISSNNCKRNKRKNRNAKQIYI